MRHQATENHKKLFHGNGHLHFTHLALEKNVLFTNDNCIRVTTNLLTIIRNVAIYRNLQTEPRIV